jgi:hypothetical protein
MKSIFFIRWSTLIISLLLLVGLSFGLADAHVHGKNFLGIEVDPITNQISSTDCGNVFPFGSQPAMIVPDMAVEASIFTSVVTPTGTIDLVMNGPAAVANGDTFSVTVVAQHVPDPGLYGVQF